MKTVKGYLRWIVAGCGVVLLLTVSGCKKSETEAPETTVTKEQKWSKEIYDDMQVLYLWNSALPSTFDATKYSTASDALTYLIGLQIDPNTQKSIDRYSFLDKIGGVSGEISEGITGDYGFSVRYPGSTSGVYPYIVYTYKNSPAKAAGLYRGLKVVKVNSVDVALDGTSSGGTGYTAMVNALFNSSSCAYTLQKADGSTFTVNLSTASYVMNSVLLDSVYTVGSKKVGYLVFNQFLEAPSMKELRSSFTKFSTAGISDLIVDLRYNGGGSVSTCDSLSSIIAPSSASGKLMNTMKFNSLLHSYYTSQYGTGYNQTYFKKEGSISLSRVFFLVSGSTASASELLMNNLKPYMDVKLIGAKTYGKPCGFWATPVGYTESQTTTKEGYDLYAVSFETVNANGSGNYYSGMAVDKEVADGVSYPFGDINENRLAEALYYIQNGAFSSNTKSLNVISGRDVIKSFNGMVSSEKRFKANIKALGK